MCSRACAAWLVTLLSVSCAGAAPTASEQASLEGEPGRGVAADAACSAVGWHVLHGPSIGRGTEPARHRESEVELDVESSVGFEVGRSSVVHSAQGDQLLIEVKNTEERWRCGVRSFPSLAYDAEGQRTARPIFDDIGYTVLGAAAMHIATREGIRGTCLGPGELGYLQIRLDSGIAKITLHLEATSDELEIGPAPTCVVPETYTYSPGTLRIQARKAGLADPTYKPAIGSGLAIVLALDEEQLPLALYSLTGDAAEASEPDKLTFVGSISLNAGTSRALSVLVW